MLAKPIGEGFLFDVSRGEPKHCGGGFDLVGRKIETVETEKNIGRRNAVLLFPSTKGWLRTIPDA